MLCAVFSGTSGAMSCAQLQLGMTYLGLFGSAALLLYLQASTLGPMPAHGMLAIVLVPACCVLVLVHRRGKYVDTSLILTADAARPSLGAKLLRMFQRVLKRCITFFVVLVVVIAGMLFYATGLPAVGRESIAALTSGTHVPAAGLIALVLFPLFHPMVDVVNWQRMAAVQKHIDAAGLEPGLRARVLNSFFRMYGTESPLLWLFMCMFGAVAVVATETPAGAHVMPAFMAQLVADPNEATVLILPLLLTGVCAMMLSAMISMFSASLCTIRYDIVPWFWPEPAPGTAQPADDATAMRRTVIAGAGFLLAVAAAFLAAEALLRIDVSSGAFLALLFALGCAQLSFQSLVLGPLVARMRGGVGAVSPNRALATMGCGVLGGAAAAAIYAATGQEAWLWAVVPACLGSGWLCFAMARRAVL